MSSKDDPNADEKYTAAEFTDYLTDLWKERVSGSRSRCTCKVIGLIQSLCRAHWKGDSRQQSHVSGSTWEVIEHIQSTHRVLWQSDSGLTDEQLRQQSRVSARAAKLYRWGEAEMNSTWASEWQKYWTIRTATKGGVIDIDHYDTLCQHIEKAIAQDIAEPEPCQDCSAEAGSTTLGRLTLSELKEMRSGLRMANYEKTTKRSDPEGFMQKNGLPLDSIISCARADDSQEHAVLMGFTLPDLKDLSLHRLPFPRESPASAGAGVSDASLTTTANRDTNPMSRRPSLCDHLQRLSPRRHLARQHPAVFWHLTIEHVQVSTTLDDPRARASSTLDE